MKLIFITKNKNKFVEAERILKEYGIIVEQKPCSLNEVRAERCEDVALHSVCSVAKKVSPPFIVEDSGLFINTLNGFPGVFSSWVFKKIGNKGILKLLQGKRNRAAVFKSAIALIVKYEKKVEKRVFVGKCKGSIAEKEKGKEGFGYDPIFIPFGYNKTFAEDIKLKDAVSHRSRGLKKLARWLIKWQKCTQEKREKAAQKNPQQKLSRNG